VRLAVGQIYQESNSFSPILTTLESFKDQLFLEGDEIPLRLQGINIEIAGFIDVIQKKRCEPIYTIVAQSVTAGPVKKEALDVIIEKLLKRINNSGRIDGIYLALHGAMLTDTTHDATGMILKIVRDKVGSNVPIVGSVDLHANMTPLMVQSVDALDAYRTFPHTDFRQVGVRATETLIRTIEKEIIPKIALCKIGMILPPESSQTNREPALQLVRAIKKIEAVDGVIAAFFCHVQPWLDIPDVGCSTVVVTDRDEEMAKEKCEELAELFWDLRFGYDPSILSVQKAIERAMKEIKGTVVFLDSADGTSSGSPGDNTEILRALLESDIKLPAFTMIVDPEVVEFAIKKGVGKEVAVFVGGKIDKRFSSSPVKLKGKVKTISDGVFRCEGPMMHGVEMHMGRTVVLVSGDVYIVVMEKSTFLWDPAVYRSVGLEPKQSKIVVVKSPVAAYADIAEEMVFVDTFGASSAHLSKMPFENVTRPLFPMEDRKRINCI
jgi:microcystin degradation protein MlrC